MPKRTILLLGDVESGKSTYLALFFDYFLKNDISEHYIVTEKDSYTMKYLSKLHTVHRNRTFDPTKIEQAINLSFSHIDSKKWKEIRIIDTPGYYTLDGFMQEKRERDFDVVFFTIDLSLDDRERMEKIEDVLSYASQIKQVLLIFTKKDRINENTRSLLSKASIKDLPSIELSNPSEVKSENVKEIEKSLEFLDYLKEEETEGKPFDSKIQDYFKKVMTKPSFNFLKRKQTGNNDEDI